MKAGIAVCAVVMVGMAMDGLHFCIPYSGWVLTVALLWVLTVALLWVLGVAW